MGVNSLPKTVTRQRRGCDLNRGTSAPEFSMLTTRLASQPTPHYILLTLDPHSGTVRKLCLEWSHWPKTIAARFSGLTL